MYCMSKLLESCHGVGSIRDIVHRRRHRPVYNGHAVVTIGIDMRRCRLFLPFAIHDSRLGPVRAAGDEERARTGEMSSKAFDDAPIA